MRAINRDNFDRPQYWLDATKQATRGAGYRNSALGTSQAIMLAVTRDSGTLDRSNWECIIRDLSAQFGDEDREISTGDYSYNVEYEPISGWHVERFGHWAIGWIEYLIVDVYSYDVPDSIEQSYLDRRDQSALTTDVFNFLADIAMKLADYPVYDESHWSELEFNELYDYVESEIKYSGILNARGDRTSLATMTGKVLDSLDNVSSIDDLRRDMIDQALRNLGYAYRR